MRVGTSKRYPGVAARQRFDRDAERIALQPRSLSDSELGADEPTYVVSPLPVRAWLDFGLTTVEVNALALAWTPRAVQVRWTTTDGDEHRPWVWRGAVRPMPS